MSDVIVVDALPATIDVTQEPAPSVVVPASTDTTIDVSSVGGIPISVTGGIAEIFAASVPTIEVSIGGTEVVSIDVADPSVVVEIGYAVGFVSGGSGTVTSVAASGTQGVTTNVTNPTTTPTITIGLGAITPSSIAASGTVTGSNLSGTNTGDQDLTPYVQGPASATSGNVAVFDGTSGKVIADGGPISMVPAGGSPGMFLETDGTTATWQYVQTVRLYARNATNSTIPKGSVVYVSGADGNHPLLSKALATNDPMSSKTIGILEQDLAHNADGYVVCEGFIDGMDTQGIADGSQLWLSAITAGAYTTTKPTAPNHLVFIGFSIKASAGNGRIFVKPQNGYELDELHDVLITTPADDEVLAYELSTQLWKNKPATVTLSNVSGLGSGVSTFLATPSSANLAAAVTNETGSGNLVFADATTSPPTANQVMKWNGSNWVPGSITNATEFSFLVTGFTVLSGGVAVSSPVEIGSGNWKPIGGLTFTATYQQNSGMTGALIQIDSGTGITPWTLPLSLSSPYTSGTSAAATVYPSPGSGSYRTLTFRITATRGAENPTRTYAVTFANRRYWGTSSIPFGYTAADVTGFGFNELTTTRLDASFTANAPTASGLYIMYATPVLLGAATFWDNATNLQFAMQAPETVTVTNASGYAEPYYVYRSSNPNLGSVNVRVE